MCLNDYQVLEFIGAGQFGKILKVRRKSDGKLFARKEVQLRGMNSHTRSQMLNEGSILQQLRHDNIVGFEEQYIDRDTDVLFIFLELCEGGDLGRKIQQIQQSKMHLAEEEILDHLVQLVNGLDYCHNFVCQGGVKRAILHRDLKPGNILLDGQGRLKLCDFGFSKDVAAADLACSTIGTPFYMSPELMKNHPYDAKSDIWALGCILYELCSHQLPFDAKSAGVLFRKIQRGQVAELPGHYSSALCELIYSMLSLDPAARPSARDLRKAPLVRMFCRRKEEQRRRQDEQREAERAAELQKREQYLRALAKELEASKAELEERAAKLAGREAEVAIFQEELSIREKEVLLHQQRLEEREAKLAERESSFRQRRLSSIATSLSYTAAGPSNGSSADNETQAASGSTLARSRRQSKKFETAVTCDGDVFGAPAPAQFRRIAAQRLSAGRTHSSPCVIVDTSDVSMQDVSAAFAAAFVEDKENRATAAASPLSSQFARNELAPRKSSPSHKLAFLAAANNHRAATAAAAAASGTGAGALPSEPIPFGLAVSARANRRASSVSVSSPAPAAEAEEESLPSPFIRKIVRTNSQPVRGPVSVKPLPSSSSPLRNAVASSARARISAAIASRPALRA